MRKPVKASTGTTISCKGWGQEAALRMLMNNLDPEVAKDWENILSLRYFGEVETLKQG